MQCRKKAESFKLFADCVRGGIPEYTDEKFLKRLYGGSAKRLVASLVQNDELKPEDIEELRKFFNEEGAGHE